MVLCGSVPHPVAPEILTLVSKTEFKGIGAPPGLQFGMRLREMARSVGITELKSLGEVDFQNHLQGKPWGPVQVLDEYSGMFRYRIDWEARDVPATFYVGKEGLVYIALDLTPWYQSLSGTTKDQFFNKVVETIKSPYMNMENVHRELYFGMWDNLGSEIVIQEDPKTEHLLLEFKSSQLTPDSSQTAPLSAARQPLGSFFYA